MNTLNLWYAATAQSICKVHDCRICHDTYGMGACPADTNVSEEEMTAFVKRMTILLNEWDEQMPFAVDISADELVDIIKQAAAIDE